MKMTYCLTKKMYKKSTSTDTKLQHYLTVIHLEVLNTKAKKIMEKIKITEWKIIKENSRLINDENPSENITILKYSQTKDIIDTIRRRVTFYRYLQRMNTDRPKKKHHLPSSRNGKSQIHGLNKPKHILKNSLLFRYSRMNHS